MTQKQIILNHLKDYGGWEYEFKLRAIETKYGWIGARGDRNVREMLASGLLEGKFDRYKGRYRMVRFKKPEIKVETFKVLGSRENKEIQLPL
jgi:hypothetical protein